MLGLPGKARTWAFVVATVALATISFAAARYAASEGQSSARADPAAAVTLASGQPNRAVVTIDGQTIDTSQPDWYLPFLEADSRKERRDITVAGIAVGPSLSLPALCGGDEVQGISPDDPGNPLRVEPRYLPAEALPQRAEATACSGEPAYWSVEYWIPPEEGFGSRVARGELSYFEARHGGAFSITRVRTTAPSFQSGIPVERWRETQVGGRPAAIGAPILGVLGESAIAWWDGAVLTVVRGTWLDSSDLIRLAEGIS